MTSVLDRLPLRTRLVAGMVLLATIGLAVAGLAATSALRSYLLGQIDEQLAAAASSPVLRTDRPDAGGPRLPGELYRVLLDADGNLVGSSHTMHGAVPDVPRLTVADSQERDLAPFTVGSSDGDGQWRVVAIPVRQGAATGTLMLASDLGEVERTVDRMVLLQLGIGALVLLGIAGLGLLVVRSSLAGLVEVEEAASAVAAGDLDRRVPERDPHTEVGRLGSAFNRMVAQVQVAFAARAGSEQRLRRFVADAGHELRTPLTSIRGFAELHRQGAVRSDAEVARLMRRIEEEAVRMGVLVDDLLTLARLDEQRPLSLDDVDLAVLASDAVHDARAVHPTRSIGLAVPGPAVVRGDESRLRQVLANLVGNAVQHTPDGTAVEVRTRTEAGWVVLEVADDGPGMEPEVAARVFERFYRADVSRARASGGSGLGLSIVASLVRAHGGRVEVASTPSHGSVFRVLLPAVTAG